MAVTNCSTGTIVTSGNTNCQRVQHGGRYTPVSAAGRCIIDGKESRFPAVAAHLHGRAIGLRSEKAMALPSTTQLPVTPPTIAPVETPNVSAGLAECLSLTEATELLDWLEGHGIRAEEVQLTDDGKMTIRWGV